MKKLLCILFLITFNLIFAQYPKDYFRSPLDIPINLSGTFGELRPNHFHSGLDIRTNNVEGLPVYASADGTILRIKVSSFGYGKALYIAHPNGYTTVYAHLQKFGSKIEAYVKAEQYRQKSFEVELYPSTLKVTKGEVIALTGNTGGSGGPHLHFEFRDTSTEKIINPMVFGMNKHIKDERLPVVQSLMVYPVSDSSAVNKGNVPISLSLQKQKDGTYLTNKVFANGKIAFGVNAHDISTNNYSKNGIYQMETFLNGSPFYSFKFETFAFDESKHINYFIDYYRYKKMSQRFQKLYNKNYFPLSIVNFNTKDGIINVQPKTNYTYRIEVSDFHANKVIVNVPICYENFSVSPKTHSGKYFVKKKTDYNFEFKKSSIYFPQNCFYENVSLNISEIEDVLSLENNYEAIQNGYTITLDASHLTDEEFSKSFVGSIDGIVLEYNSSFRKDKKVSAKVKAFGKYKVGIDAVAPRIYNPNFIEGSNISKLSTLSVSINDALSGIDSYNGYLNGEWILMDYDYKTKKLIHNFSDAKAVSGRNEIKIIVTDKLNNTTTFNSFFIR